MKQVNGNHVCPYCGTQMGAGNQGYTMNPQPQRQAPAGNPADSDSIGWGVLGFFFPLVGFILWLVWKNEYPKKAKRCGRGALISIILSFVLGIVLGISSAAMTAAVVSNGANAASLAASMLACI